MEELKNYQTFSGKKIGRRTLIKYIPGTKKTHGYYNTQCECGHIGRVRPSRIEKDIECFKCANDRKRKLFEIGQRVGSWTILERMANGRSGTTVYKCKCDCGTVKDVAGVGLRVGDRLRCKGCATRERNLERGSKNKTNLANDLFDNDLGVLDV